MYSLGQNELGAEVCLGPKWSWCQTVYEPDLGYSYLSFGTFDSAGLDKNQVSVHVWCCSKFMRNKVEFIFFVFPSVLQSVKGESGKSLSSKFGQNQCLYYNKQYISRKPLISALIWHPESGRGNIRRAWPCHRRQRVKNRPRAHKIQQNMLFAAGGRGGLLVKPCPLSGSQIKAEIKGFLLMYRLFLYYLWFFQNIEKDWRKYFS